MKQFSCMLAAALFAAGAVFAQGGGAQPPAGGQKIGLAMSLQRSYNGIKTNLTAAADKLAEADYGFKPGSMPEVRTFGQLFGHVANSQFAQCAALKGVANPNQGTNNEQKTTKAEFQKALADSFAFCDDAIAALTDANVTEMVKQGQNEVTRAAIAAGLIAHDNEMYGTAAVYLRSKGVVPPSTEGRGRRGGN
jgi:uncharacterized damage-inducible protein DinB